MFNRYWRSYPWFFQLLQFIILLMVLASFFIFALTPLVLKALNVPATELINLNENSPRPVINAMLIIQTLSSAGIFLLPALLFAYFTHPRPMDYLGLKIPGKSVQWILAPLVMLSATPLFLFIAELVSHIDFGQDVKQAQEASDQAFKGLLNMTSPTHLLASLFVMAILPGISEELFFRGLLMRFAAKRSRAVIFPLLVSSLFFALAHSNIYGMFSIFIAGGLLAGIYYLTGSLWCSVLAHMTYNGAQVIFVYAARSNPTLKAIEATNTVPVSWVVTGGILFIIFFCLLWKNRTPLSPGWSADYTPEELMEQER